MAITVAELVAIPFLQISFRAGAGGGARLVTWAHTSDVADPTEWLEPGDLLMSNGLNVPPDAEGQESFLDQLAGAGLSAFAIGDDMHAPPLSAALLERADELDFPLLAIPRDVPFVAVSRAVANANSDEEHKRLIDTVQLYEVLRDAVSTGRVGPALLDELGQHLRCRLVLLDGTTALPVLTAGAAPPAGLGERLIDELRARHGVFPGVLRVRHNGLATFAIHVPTTRPTALVAMQSGDETPDLALLQHAANIAALEAERVTAEREHERRQGSELLAAMLERRLEPASAQERLAGHGIDAASARLVSFVPSPSGADEGNLHHELAQRGLPHLILSDPSRCLLAVPGGDEALTALRSAVGPEVALGVSDPLRRPDRAPDAAREASWAQTAAQNLAQPLVRYGESSPLFLPRTLGEAEIAVERVLEPILHYDDLHSTDLLGSLGVFLEQNRSWQRSAELLHVHKQTLVYRMRRVEQLTGRDLRNTADVVQLWLALRALEFVRGVPTAG